MLPRFMLTLSTGWEACTRRASNLVLEALATTPTHGCRLWRESLLHLAIGRRCTRDACRVGLAKKKSVSRTR